MRVRTALASALIAGLMRVGIITPEFVAGAHPVAASTGAGASVVQHGLRVSILPDRAVYPWHALARVTIRVDNLSPYLAIVPFGTSCPSPFPGVTVQNRLGRDVGVAGISAVMPCLPVTGGGGPVVAPSHLPGARLTPGATRSWTRYVVLNGARLTTQVSAVLASGEQIVWSGGIITPTARVRFTTGVKPTVRFCSAGPACATITPASGTHVSGPLYYASAAAVVRGDGTVEILCNQFLSPRPARSPTLHPGCGVANVWHLMAGWLDHRVVEVNWKRPQS
jgi:hypothetical protein